MLNVTMSSVEFSTATLAPRCVCVCVTEAMDVGVLGRQVASN